MSNDTFNSLSSQLNLDTSDMFRTGVLHISDAGCALVLQADLEYWGVDESSMEACCTLKYYPKIEVSFPSQDNSSFSL